MDDKAVFRPLPPKENAGLHASCRLYEHLAGLCRNGRDSGKSPILVGIAVTHMRGAALLLVVTLAASDAPALRILRLDPAATLRNE